MHTCLESKRGRRYGGPEGPCPLPNTIFPITNFDFSHYQLPIWLFLVSDLEFSHYQLPIWVFLISTSLVYYRRCQLCAYRRSCFNCEYLLIVNCEFLCMHFAINRFANINMHVYYSTVRGRLSQLLDSQFGSLREG